MINENQGAEPFQDLGKDEGEAPVTEQLGESGLDPQRYRRLVHGHESDGIKRHKKEIVPVHHHASHRRGVIRVAGAVLVDFPETKEGSH